MIMGRKEETGEEKSQKSQRHEQEIASNVCLATTKLAPQITFAIMRAVAAPNEEN